MLDLDIATIAFQILNFLALTALLYWFLLRPVMRRVQERVAEKERLMQEMAQERAQAARVRAELEERLARAEEEAAAIINSAQERIEAARRSLVEEAYKEAERILEEARDEGRRLRQQALAESYSDILNVIIELSGAAIRQAAPPELHEHLVKRLTDSVWELGRSDIRRVEDFRRSLGERAPTATIITARSLTSEQQGVLARTLTALADRQVNLEIKVDPKLVAGVRARVGDMLIDSSIAGDLEEFRESVGRALRDKLHHG
jgi:F-type H+-transporting ATPase subunit b